MPVLSFRKLFYMPPTCKVCGQNYYPEPGFYYGAMFISYIITAFYCLGFVAICIFVFHLGIELSFVLLFFSLVLLYAWFFRTSRAVWIHIVVKYDPHTFSQSGDDK
jgi:hypothetical protein